MEQAQQQQQTFQQQAQQQQQSFQQMVQESMNSYMQMFNIPHSYLQEGMRLAQEDTPGTAQQEIEDEIRKTKRRSSKQSSEHTYLRTAKSTGRGVVASVFSLRPHTPCELPVLEILGN